MSARNSLKILFNTLLGLVLILIWAHFVNLSQIWRTIQGVHLSFLGLFVLFFILATVFRAIRLQFLLKVPGLELKELIFLNFISQFLSFTIPIRAGEIAKGVYLSSRLSQNGTGPVRRHPRPMSSLLLLAAGTRWGTPTPATRSFTKVNFLKVLLWVFIDRFLDFWVYIIIVALLVFLIPNNLPPKGKLLVVALVGIFSLSALLMILANNLSQRLIQVSSKLLVVPKLQKIFSETALKIAQAFVILDRPLQDIVRLLLLSLLAVGSDLMTFVAVYLSFNPQINLLKVLLGSGLTVFTFLIPAAPGYVGSVEASNLAIFSGVVGFEPILVSGAALVFHILTLVLLPIFGIASIYFLKFDLGLVWSKLRKN